MVGGGGRFDFLRFDSFVEVEVVVPVVVVPAAALALGFRLEDDIFSLPLSLSLSVSLSLCARFVCDDDRPAKAFSSLFFYNDLFFFF